MNFKKIFVLGAGAIGSTYGALLSQKNDVTLIGRKTHVDAINSHGLMTKGHLTGKFPVKAETKINEILPNSLIILTTKAQDSAEAVSGIKHLLKPNTVILVLQNGLKIKKQIQRVVGDKIEIVRGLTLMAAEFLEPGKISFWNGQTIIEHTKTGQKIATLFRKSGLMATIAKDITKEEWTKLIINCVINPLTAILRIRNNELAIDCLKQTRHNVVEECIEVGEAEGASFDPELKKHVDQRVSSYTNFSSMYQDIVKGKKTEIDFLNGTIVELGKKHGIPTPVNEALVGLIEFLEVKK